LGWIRYLDSKKEIKNPYVLNLEGVLDFIYKNKELTNIRAAIH
jgi:hypothetical protein